MGQAHDGEGSQRLWVKERDFKGESRRDCLAGTIVVQAYIFAGRCERVDDTGVTEGERRRQEPKWG